MLLFPNEIFNLLKPADNQRIEQTFRKLVVLNVVGSNPTSHPEEILDNRDYRGFSFCDYSVYNITSRYLIEKNLKQSFSPAFIVYPLS